MNILWIVSYDFISAELILLSHTLCIGSFRRVRSVWNWTLDWRGIHRRAGKWFLRGSIQLGLFSLLLKSFSSILFYLILFKGCNKIDLYRCCLGISVLDLWSRWVIELLVVSYSDIGLLNVNLISTVNY